MSAKPLRADGATTRGQRGGWGWTLLPSTSFSSGRPSSWRGPTPPWLPWPRVARSGWPPLAAARLLERGLVARFGVVGWWLWASAAFRLWLSLVLSLCRVCSRASSVSFAECACTALCVLSGVCPSWRVCGCEKRLDAPRAARPHAASLQGPSHGEPPPTYTLGRSAALTAPPCVQAWSSMGSVPSSLVRSSRAS